MSPCDLSPILLYGVNSANGANGTKGANGVNGANSANGANSTNGTNGANGASTQALFDGRGVICAFSSKPL